MRVLLVLGIALLYLLLFILLLVLLLLSIKVRIIAEGENGKLRVALQYGPLRIPVYPFPTARKSSKKEKKKPSVAGVQGKEALELLLDLLEDCKRSLKIDVLRVNILIGTGDAAKTGILLGTIAAITGILLPFLEKNYVIRDMAIAVDGDFEAAKTKWSASFSCAIRPAAFILALIRHRKQISVLLHQLQKEANE